MGAQSLTCCLLAVALLAGCADLSHRVVRVADGDTVTALKDGTEVKIRLVEIYAPEKAQAYGAASTQSLTELCLNKVATLEEQGKDRYGRTLAKVHCDGIDANREQVAARSELLANVENRAFLHHPVAKRLSRPK